MKSLSFRKLSVLGVVLMTASAVTAAILPSKNKKSVASNGVIKMGTAAGHQTCTNDVAQNCIYDTATTAEGGLLAGTTANNNTSGVTTLE